MFLIFLCGSATLWSIHLGCDKPCADVLLIIHRALWRNRILQIIRWNYPAWMADAKTRFHQTADETHHISYRFRAADGCGNCRCGLGALDVPFRARLGDADRLGRRSGAVSRLAGPGAGHPGLAANV